MDAMTLPPPRPTTEEARPLEVGFAVGAALPAGEIERGSRLSDVTYGVAFASGDVALRLRGPFSAGFTFSFGGAAPKLCANGSECVASIGRDASLGVLGRVRVARFGAVAPTLEATLGYEWLGVRLVDADATSSREARGVSAGLAAQLPFVLSTRFTLGPAIGVRAGIFARARVDAPGIATAKETDGPRVHAWPSVSLRLAARL